MAYAEGTQVSSDQSMQELRRVLRRYLAEQIATMEGTGGAAVGFKLSGRFVRIEVPLPAPDDERFTLTPTGKDRTANAAREAWERECRRLWRALVLVVKAKLEAIESGLSTFDAEFLAHIVLPGGHTIGQLALPQVEQAYKTGELGAAGLKLLPG